MKVKIDKELCVGSRDCAEICPEVFKMEGDKAVVQTEEVPKEEEGRCQSAEGACPAAAIRIES